MSAAAALASALLFAAGAGLPLPLRFGARCRCGTGWRGRGRARPRWSDCRRARGGSCVGPSRARPPASPAASGAAPGALAATTVVSLCRPRCRCCCLRRAFLHAARFRVCEQSARWRPCPNAPWQLAHPPAMHSPCFLSGAIFFFLVPPLLGSMSAPEAGAQSTRWPQPFASSSAHPLLQFRRKSAWQSEVRAPGVAILPGALDAAAAAGGPSRGS